MVPPSILQNLASLRQRERLLTFVWGLACFISTILVLLLLCCAVDWLIDRDRDTPFAVRAGLLILQFGVAIVAGFFFILWPQVKSLSDDSLALWVESKIHRFDHRLISAVQLNRPGADLAGMSRELVALMTQEAEQESARHPFAATADHARLGGSAKLLVPVVLVCVMPFLIFPGVSFALLARQALLDRDIPRSVYLESASKEVWPMGETIPIFYRVTGKYDADMIGTVYVSSSTGPTDRYPLEFVLEDEQGALFKAEVTGASDNIRYWARLSDGRTRAPSEMRIVPRPVVTENQAWVILPAYCGKRPDGERYERPQVRGDVIGIPGSGVRVQFEVHRPIQSAWLDLKGYERIDAKTDDEDVSVREVLKRKVPMQITQKVDPKTEKPLDVWHAEATFDLTPDLSSYHMGVLDEDGFENIPKPRRALRLVTEEAPQITLLKDTFDLGEGSTFDLEGLPVVLGKQIRIPYRADGAYGIGKVQVLYRVLKKHESGEMPQEDEEWTKLSMPEEKHPGANFGSFDPRSGVFAGMKFNQQVSFYAIPSPNPDLILGRTTAGGRYFLETKNNALITSKGQPIQLKSGDQIEYCVEVFAMEREPKGSTPSSRSETRVATMMSQKEFETWISQVGQEDERVRQLELKQKNIFERK